MFLARPARLSLPRVSAVVAFYLEAKYWYFRDTTRDY